MKITNHTQSILFKIYAFLVYCVPMFVLFFVNIDKYTSSSKFSFLGIIVLGFIAIAFANTVKKIINYNIGLSVSAIVFVISLLAQYLGEQMIIISFASFIGSVLSMIVGEIANTYYRFSFIVDEQGNKRKNKAKAMTLKEIWSETVFSLKDEVKK